MKKRRFVSVMTVYIFMTLADISLTYINTPDLSKEANPLITVLDLSWGALITAMLLSIIILVSMSYYSCFKYITVRTNDKRITEYISTLSYDRPDKFWIGGIPKHISHDIAALGYALPWGMSVYRFLCVCEWLTITFNVDMVAPYSILRIDNLFYIPSTVITLILFFYWFYNEYRKQLIDNKHTDECSTS